MDVCRQADHLTPLEQLATVSGDVWVWIAFSPVCKLVPAWVVGQRTLCHARRLVFQLKSATDGHMPFFTSDALPTTPTPCWRSMVYGVHRHVKGRVDVCPNSAVNHRPTCVTWNTS